MHKAIRMLGVIDAAVTAHGITGTEEITTDAVFERALTDELHGLTWGLQVADAEGNPEVGAYCYLLFEKPEPNARTLSIEVFYNAHTDRWSGHYEPTNWDDPAADELAKRLALEPRKRRELTESEAREALGMITGFFQTERMKRAT